MNRNYRKLPKIDFFKYRDDLRLGDGLKFHEILQPAGRYHIYESICHLIMFIFILKFLYLIRGIRRNVPVCVSLDLSTQTEILIALIYTEIHDSWILQKTCTSMAVLIISGCKKNKTIYP